MDAEGIDHAPHVDGADGATNGEPALGRNGDVKRVRRVAAEREVACEPPSSSIHACWTGCSRPPLARPSMVVIGWPATEPTAVTQDRNALPRTCTVQAPHSPAPQPNLAPVSRRSSRRTHSSGLSGSVSTSDYTGVMQTEKIKIRTETGQTLEVVVFDKRADRITIVLGEGVHSMKCDLMPTRNGLAYAGTIKGREIVYERSRDQVQADIDRLNPTLRQSSRKRG